MEKLLKPTEKFKVAKAADLEAKTFQLVGQFNSGTRQPAKGQRIMYPPTYIIPSEDMVYMRWVDKDGVEQVGQRHIRYCPSAQSIFADEQPLIDNKPPKKGEIKFIEGFLSVSPKEVLLLKFLELANFNQDNEETKMPGVPTLYKPLDAEKEARRINEEKKAKFQVNKMIYEMDGQELKGLAQTFYIRDFKRKSSEELQMELVEMADRNPAKFMEEVNKEERKMKFFILQALDRNIITYNANDNQLSWTKGGYKIETAPVGLDAIDFFIEMALTKDSAKNIYEAIKDAVSDKIFEFKEEIPLKEYSVEEMIDMASKKGAIAIGDVWTKINGVNYGPGKETALNKIKEDEKAIEFLKNVCK